ncbi:MAG: hypothetical protein FWG04_03220 [Desulfovibrionaceae bacterium]|nr:hypothetical protein [Desulfovibrionaceae bacterium]
MKRTPRAGRRAPARGRAPDARVAAPRPRAEQYIPAREPNLLARPGPELIAVLDTALAALARAFPIPAGHRKDLPPAVRELSRILTSERGELSRSYWSAPRLATAYLYFFLPWNIFRLAWLLPGLDMPLRPGNRILDLGSGPLTLPIALWCARPDLRQTPLSFDCVDVAVKPMEYGRSVFYALAGEDSPWRIFPQRSPVEKALRLAGREALKPPQKKAGQHGPAPNTPAQGGYDCIMAGNILNELCAGSAQGNAQALSARLEELTGLAHGALLPEGRLFLLEPGTRFGGKLISLARKGALQQGFAPLAPCTHDAACPMLEQAGSYTGWCHFIHPAENAPAALRELSAKARLEKDSLALSCLLLRRTGQIAATPLAESDSLDELEALYAEITAEDALLQSNKNTAGHEDDKDHKERQASGHLAHAVDSPLARTRVISAPIRLPGSTEPARYACCAKGLALLLDAARTPSGAYVTLPWPDKEQRDAKTGALILKRN